MASTTNYRKETEILPNFHEGNWIQLTNLPNHLVDDYDPGLRNPIEPDARILALQQLGIFTIEIVSMIEFS
jgi:hypothetical protein